MQESTSINISSLCDPSILLVLWLKTQLLESDYILPQIGIQATNDVPQISQITQRWQQISLNV